MHTKYGTVGSTLTEELLRSGSQTASQVILKCFSSAENKDTMAAYRDTFVQMVRDNYLIRCPMPRITESPVIIPVLEIEQHLLFRPPDLDLGKLQKLQSGSTTEVPDGGMSRSFLLCFNNGLFFYLLIKIRTGG